MIATLAGQGLCHARGSRWVTPVPWSGDLAQLRHAMIATLVGRGLRPCSGKCFPLWHGVAWVRPLVASEHAFGIVFGKKCARQVVFGVFCDYVRLPELKRHQSI